MSPVQRAALLAVARHLVDGDSIEALVDNGAMSEAEGSAWFTLVEVAAREEGQARRREAALEKVMHVGALATELGKPKGDS